MASCAMTMTKVQNTLNSMKLQSAQHMLSCSKCQSSGNCLPLQHCMAVSMLLLQLSLPRSCLTQYISMQEFMPIMHSQLATPATVLAKNATVATGILQIVLVLFRYWDCCNAGLLQCSCVILLALLLLCCCCCCCCCCCLRTIRICWHTAISQDVSAQTDCIHCTGSTLATLFTVPLNKKRKRDSESQHQQKHAQNGSQKPFPPAYYAVTLKQMEANYYPLPIVDDAGHMTYPSGFVATQPAGLLSLLPLPAHANCIEIPHSAERHAESVLFPSLSVLHHLSMVHNMFCITALCDSGNRAYNCMYLL